MACCSLRLRRMKNTAAGHARGARPALSPSSSPRWRKGRICKQVIRSQILPDLDSWSPLSPAPMRGHTHQTEHSPEECRALWPGKPQLTPACPAPGAGPSQSSALISRASRAPGQPPAQTSSLGPGPQSSLDGAAVSPNSGKPKVHLLCSLPAKAPSGPSPFSPHLPCRQLLENRAGENESQCQIPARQRGPLLPWPPPLQAWHPPGGSGGLGPAPAAEDLFMLRSIKGNQALL